MIQKETIYICIEELVTEDGARYEPKEKISENVYAYLQPKEREHFEEYKSK